MPPVPNCVVLDNGGGLLKIGLAGNEDPFMIAPNCIARGKGKDKRRLVADQLNLAKETSGLQYMRPFDRGMLNDLDVEKEIWDRVLGKQGLNVDIAESSLLVTLPPFLPEALESSFQQMIFEEYGFQSLCCALAASLSIFDRKYRQLDGVLNRPPGCLVVDAGFSFTHVVPVWDNIPMNYAIKRLNVGGKLLTNYMKELISYSRYGFDMMEETFVVNEIKEKLCCCSTDLAADLETCRPTVNPLRRDYVLPDFRNDYQGYVKEVNSSDPSAVSAPLVGKAPGRSMEEQVLILSNERISVPEVLFHPSDIGLDQAGVAELIVQSIAAIPADLRPIFAENISLIGGSTMFPNFKTRLEQELRPLLPVDWEVKIHQTDRPMLSAWRGGSEVAASQDYPQYCVTKAEYEEYGHAICRARFRL
eukprot:GILK01008594.1.p1 GENE.GILK01008594.1~~GILK01008594.1.p1  ORF type:complete len:418 (+),score=55.78 GILK01008594.1:54-1307(+)